MVLNLFSARLAQVCVLSVYITLISACSNDANVESSRNANNAADDTQDIALGSPRDDDPLAPKSSVDDAVVSPLRVATLVTNDMAAARVFYEDGMGMTCSFEQIDLESLTLWSLTGDATNWQMTMCKRPNTQGGISVRVLASELAGPDSRGDFNVTRNGILSLGFAIENQKTHVDKMATIGGKPNDGITTITLPNVSGGTYVVKETHYRGPHNTYNLGIERPEGFDPVGPLDLVTGVGGPAYSGMMASDPDAFKSFMEDVLGYETRRDLEFPSDGPGGGLIGIKKGTLLRFVQMYSPGSTTDYIIVLGVGTEGKPATSLPKPPNSGLVMWSFETKEFDDVLSRVNTAGLANLRQANTAKGKARRMSFDAPNGVMIEVSESLPTANILAVSEPVSCAVDAKPAMMIVEGDNQKPKQFQAYTKALQEAQIYEQLDGYYMTIGDPAEVFEGEWPEQKFMVVARFACKARAQQFWHSDTYNKIKSIRQGAGDVRALLFEEFAIPERIDWVK